MKIRIYQFALTMLAGALLFAGAKIWEQQIKIRIKEMDITHYKSVITLYRKQTFLYQSKMYKAGLAIPNTPHIWIKQ
jgi:hypothetical protein